MRNSPGNGSALGKTGRTITAYFVMRVSANTVSETPMTSRVRSKGATTVTLSTLRNQAEFMRGCAGRVLRECSRCLIGVFAVCGRALQGYNLRTLSAAGTDVTACFQQLCDRRPHTFTPFTNV